MVETKGQTHYLYPGENVGIMLTLITDGKDVNRDAKEFAEFARRIGMPAHMTRCYAAGWEGTFLSPVDGDTYIFNRKKPKA